ncbi:unnamed protein product [Urochloa decumbens]|uniref:TF-B3 domain-containing protein n=1 Tax=Urochloa decumbens TaxID=240449 RepID=A0ABC8WT70_9POAL
MAAVAAYEAQRQQQIEENKRKIEELGLRHLAAAAMPPQAKQLKPKHKARMPGAATAAPPRRSGRVANLPEQPDYRENFKKKMTGVTDVERSYAIAKAKELLGQLGAHHPTFVKHMTQYYATGWPLALPTQFCREHLPEHDELITLVDEEDHESVVHFHNGRNDRHYYINWKGFVINHNLDDGDCLVFQLIQQRRFKVYILKAPFLLK